MSKMDPFQRIPFHVLLHIVKSVQDLPSLLHLLHASPTISCLFNDCAPEIFDAVAQRSIPQNIQTLLHTIAYIRAGKTESDDLYDFTSKIGSYTIYQRRPVKEDERPSSSVLRDILALACHIQHLGDQCISDMLQRCSKLNLSHLVDKCSPEKPTGPKCYVHPRSPHPRMQPYELQGSGGPPSWMEVQRVHRALWRLQLFYDVQRAAASGDKFNWPAEHVHKILNMAPETFWDSMEHRLLEELRTVGDCVKRIYPDSSKSQLPTYRGSISYSWPVLIAENSIPVYSRWSPTVYLNQPACGHAFIEGLSRSSVLPYVGFRPFRSYGLSIWDRRRLMALELARVLYSEEEGEYPGITMSATNLHFTWRSIMTNEDFHYWDEKVRQTRDEHLPYYVYAEM